jgi:hypothetical protein
MLAQKKLVFISFSAARCQSFCATAPLDRFRSEISLAAVVSRIDRNFDNDRCQFSRVVECDD